MDGAWRTHGWKDTYIPSFDKKTLEKDVVWKMKSHLEGQYGHGS